MKKAISTALGTLPSKTISKKAIGKTTIGKTTVCLCAGFFLCYEGVQAQFGGGSGTIAAPYEINTIEHLNNIRDHTRATPPGENYLNAVFRLTTDLDFSDVDGNGTDYVYSPDAAENAKGWLPLGDPDNPFIGSFDGDDHVIRNLFIDRSSDNSFGLFGQVGHFGMAVGPAGKIENLGLEDVSIRASGVASEVGGLVGANGISISNCYVTGRVTGSGTSTGGLAGGNGSIIRNCYATANVSGAGQVGGLVGHDFLGTIENCYATGDVTGTTNHTGGLVGQNEGTLSSSYSTGAVSGLHTVGGLVGTNRHIISSCYATGSVGGTGTMSEEAGLTGGLVGQNGGDISNCYATGVVSGDNMVGGLVGGNASEAGISNCYATGLVSGDNMVGGLVGNEVSSSGTVESSYWNIETSGQRSSASGIRLTTLQMYDQSSYLSWDFSAVWHGPEAARALFPLLRGVGKQPSDVPLPPPPPSPPTPMAITGVGDEEALHSLLLFPNPVADVLGLAGVEAYTRIAIYDSQGRRVHRQTAGARVDLRHLPEGAYLMKIHQGNSLRRVRILKR